MNERCMRKALDVNSRVIFSFSEEWEEDTSPKIKLCDVLPGRPSDTCSVSLRILVILGIIPLLKKKKGKRKEY